MSNYGNKALIELWDAATALHDVVEKAKSIPPSRKAKPLLDYIEASRPFIEAVEARWGEHIWERHRKRREEIDQMTPGANGHNEVAPVSGA
jgi:hypothetical protein